MTFVIGNESEAEALAELNMSSTWLSFTASISQRWRDEEGKVRIESLLNEDSNLKL